MTGLHRATCPLPHLARVIIALSDQKLELQQELIEAYLGQKSGSSMLTPVEEEQRKGHLMILGVLCLSHTL